MLLWIDILLPIYMNEWRWVAVWICRCLSGPRWRSRWTHGALSDKSSTSTSSFLQICQYALEYFLFCFAFKVLEMFISHNQLNSIFQQLYVTFDSYWVEDDEHQDDSIITFPAEPASLCIDWYQPVLKDVTYSLQIAWFLLVITQVHEHQHMKFGI